MRELFAKIPRRQIPVILILSIPALFIIKKILDAFYFAGLILYVIYPLIIVVIFILYLLWMRLTYKWGEKRYVLYQLAFLCFFSLFSIYKSGYIPATHDYKMRKLTTVLTGRYYPLSAPRYEFENHSDSGDDYSLDIYDIPDSEVKDFLDYTDKRNYPELPAELANWKCVNWREGTNSNEDVFVLQSALSDRYVAYDPKLKQVYENVWNSLSEPTTFYSYIRNMRDSRDIEIYIFDPVARQLVVITHYANKHAHQ